MKRLVILLILIGVASSVGMPTGTVTCPSSGSRVILSTHAPTNNFTILAPGTGNATPNTGIVYWGGPGVTTSTGFPLIPGSSYTTPARSTATPYDLGTVYIACSVSSDTLYYVYY